MHVVDDQEFMNANMMDKGKFPDSAPITPPTAASGYEKVQNPSYATTVMQTKTFVRV